jgi:hypothetical protein
MTQDNNTVPVPTTIATHVSSDGRCTIKEMNEQYFSLIGLYPRMDSTGKSYWIIEGRLRNASTSFTFTQAATNARDKKFAALLPFLDSGDTITDVTVEQRTFVAKDSGETITYYDLAPVYGIPSSSDYASYLLRIGDATRESMVGREFKVISYTAQKSPAGYGYLQLRTQFTLQGHEYTADFSLSDNDVNRSALDSSEPERLFTLLENQLEKKHKIIKYYTLNPLPSEDVKQMEFNRDLEFDTHPF